MKKSHLRSHCTFFTLVNLSIFICIARLRTRGSFALPRRQHWQSRQLLGKTCQQPGLWWSLRVLFSLKCFQFKSILPTLNSIRFAPSKPKSRRWQRSSALITRWRRWHKTVFVSPLLSLLRGLAQSLDGRMHLGARGLLKRSRKYPPLLKKTVRWEMFWSSPYFHVTT